MKKIKYPEEETRDMSVEMGWGRLEHEHKKHPRGLENLLTSSVSEERTDRGLILSTNRGYVP